jgi:hypothetical protein
VVSKISSLLGPRKPPSELTPVILPPGLLRLATMPSARDRRRRLEVAALDLDDVGPNGPRNIFGAHVLTKRSP